MRFTFRIPTSVLGGFERQVVSARTQGLKVNGRRISNEAVLAAILLHFADLPEAERDAAIRTYSRRVEAILAASVDEPVQPSQAPEASRPSKPGVEVVEETADDFHSAAGTAKPRPKGKGKGRRPAG